MECSDFLIKCRAVCFLHVVLPRSLQIEITILCLLSLKSLERQKIFFFRHFDTQDTHTHSLIDIVGY